MHKAKTLALGSVMAASLVASSAALAEVSANVSAVSQYYFRGVQLTDSAAVQGGVDWAHDSGFYLGTWASTLNGGDPSYEIDFYGGFGNEIGDFSYDVGYILYTYPDNSDKDVTGFGNYGEIYASVGWNWLTLGLAYTSNSELDKDDGGGFVPGDLYYYAGLDFGLPQDWSLGFVLGAYTFTNDGKTPGGEYNYNHLTASLGKDAGDYGAFNLNLEMTDADEENDLIGTANSDKPKIWVGWSKDF